MTDLRKGFYPGIVPPGPLGLPPFPPLGPERGGLEGRHAGDPPEWGSFLRFAGGAPGRLLGDFLLVGAALLWGVYGVGFTLAVQRRTPLEITAASMLLVSLLLLPAALFTPFPQASPSAWGALLYTAIGGAFLAFTPWARVLGRHPASQVAPLLNLTPALALAFSLLLGEAPGAWDLLGLLSVALGIYLSGRKG